MRLFQNVLSFAPLAVIMLLPLCAPANGAGASNRVMASAPRFTDPGEIDRVVADFTGFRPGEVGGARTPADRRLRLAACSAPLKADWHGATRSSVRVECGDPGGWAIFIATRPAPQSAASARVVARGDRLTVMVRGRGFSVQQSGEAMEAGGIGDWIEVRTTRQGDPVHARIERPGLAVIPAD